MRADRQQAQDVLPAEDDEQQRFQSAIDGGVEGVAARLQQPGRGGDELLGPRDVLQHFQAGHDVERAGLLLGKLLGADVAIVDGKAGVARDACVPAPGDPATDRRPSRGRPAV